ncbi:MAG: hypothetical protein ABFC38_09535 [Methanospirillum sp.]
MSNYVQSGVVKTAVRELAAPIADVAAFAEVVDDVLTNNPFGCTAYQVGTENHAAVEKTGETYTGRVVYENGEAETVGTVSVKCPTVAAYTANVATVLGNAALATAMGGTGAHATDDDSFSAALRCHAANGEVFTLALSRTKLTLSSYEDDAIRSTVENWTDAVPTLASPWIPSAGSVSAPSWVSSSSGSH